MKRTIEEIQREETGYFLHETGSGKVQFEWPSEFDTGLNNLSREKLDAYMEIHEEVWLGKVNRYNYDKDRPYLVKYEGQKVYNFEYTFAIPCYDQELIDLIIEREEAEYTGTAEDEPRVQKIMDRIYQLRGIDLFWV